MSQAKTKKVFYQQIKLSLIDPPPMPDRMSLSVEAVRELADSIQAVGLLQPILLVVRDDRYEIIYGHRRFLACQTLGNATIAAKVVEYSDQEVALARATENLQRENLTPIEEAKIYVRLTQDLGLSPEEAGRMTGKSAGVVLRRMGLLKMPDIMQTAIHGGKITIAVAEELRRCLAIAYQDYLLDMAVDHGVTRIVAKGWVDDHLKSLRTAEADVAGGQGISSVYDSPPSFVACETCSGPVDLNKVKLLRICPDCFETIRQNLTK